MSIEIPADLRQTGRRFGYGIAIAINVALLILVNNIVEWGLSGFITDGWSDVVPWINVSLSATLLANVIYMFNDAPVVKSSGQLVTNVITFLASYQIFRVFPFDFSGYTFNWGIVIRILLIVAMAGSAIGAVTEAYKLVSGKAAHSRP